MRYNDFVVKYDPAIDTMEDLVERILYDAFIRRRLKANKPSKIGIFGGSGEGKSWAVERLLEILLGVQGIDPLKCIRDVNVFVPLEYPKKIGRLLGTSAPFEETGLKDVNFIAVHEARELVKAKHWQSFINTAIADINEMSRSIKRMGFMIVSQDITDITKDVRKTLNFYIKCDRPFRKKTRLVIYTIWVNDRDLEKPRLQKRRFGGCLIYPDGRMKRYVPRYLELSRPSKEIVEIFEKSDVEAKADIIKRKLNKLMKEMSLDLDVQESRINSLVEHYSSNLEQISTIGKRYKDKWKLKPVARDMFELSEDEGKRFEEKLNSKLRRLGADEFN